MTTLRHELHDWWQGLPAALRAPAWRSAFAALVILALLLGFHQVVRQAVRQGELLRMSTATHAQAVWRCNSLNGARLRQQCLQELNAPLPVRLREGPPPNTATLAQADR
jgi:hypothetical protein